MSAGSGTVQENPTLSIPVANLRATGAASASIDVGAVVVAN